MSAHMAQPAAATIRPAFTAETTRPQLRLVDVAPQTDPVRQMMYIHAAVPAKDAQIGPRGECDFVIQCFPVPAGTMPGQLAAMRFDEKEAVYKTYRGFISRHKGEDGMVPGYVYQATMMDDAVTATDFMMYRAPTVHVEDTKKGRFPGSKDKIQTYQEQIATEAAINARRYPVKAVPARRNMTCGG